MSAAAPSAPVRTAPLALWRVAEAFLGVLNALFGAPEQVAARHTLTAKAHAHLASWLRAGEAMLRRLLLTEAAAFPKPNTRPLLRPPRQRVRKLREFSADAPDAWRVSFRIFHLPPRRGGSAEPRGGEAKGEVAREENRFRAAWPLAERYEALIRVFNDPAAYARRLARRLHATPHRLGEILRAPPEATHRIDRFEALGDQARAVWRERRESG
jgi:hypothetical protein